MSTPQAPITRLPLAAVREMLLGRLSPAEPLSMALSGARGLVCAIDLVAPSDIPARPLALQAGWAVASSDTVGVSSYTPAVVATAWTEAGQFLPAPCDAVLPSDAVDDKGGVRTALVQVAPGEGARLAGQDVLAGQVLIRAGERITPLKMAVALASGVDRVFVRQPSVAVLGGGDNGPGPGRILLEALVQQDGTARLAAHRAEADLVIQIGDDAFPADPRMALVPAERGGVREDQGTLVVIAPERPEGALAIWIGLILPALAILSGAGVAASQSGKLSGKLTSTVGLSELSVIAATLDAAGVPLWRPLATGDIPWSALARATIALLTEPNSEGERECTIVTGYPV